MDRTLRFKGFSSPVHIDDLDTVNKSDERDWDRVRYLEQVEQIEIRGYYSAIDDAMQSLWA